MGRIEKLKRIASEWGSHLTFGDYAIQIGGLIVTGLLWVAAAVTPWLEAAGPFGWFLMALAGTTLLAAISVPVSAMAAGAVGNFRAAPTPAGTQAKDTGIASLSPSQEASRQPTKIETVEDRKTKHDLSVFLLEFVLPACKAHGALQFKLAMEIGGKTDYIMELIDIGLNEETHYAKTSSPQRSGRLTPATCRGDKNETGT